MTPIWMGARSARSRAVAVWLVLVVVGVSACGSSTSAPPTSRVERGEVSTRVSASGALASVTSQNLG
ncbi:hypothetical protein, partial [Pseudonocardia sp.]|uniref:hypothetical protein n=1 Tax=Pseudonocardia sp. TaxID=60912 RepID=UPI002F42A96B